MMLKVKFMRNTAILDVINSSPEILILDPNEVLGILDLRSLGYYEIKQGVLQQNLSRYYEFKLAEKVCEQYNNLINTLKKEQSMNTGEKYPWLDHSDERKHMLCKAVLSFKCNCILYFFIWMSRGFEHPIFIWCIELTQLCSSSGSLFSMC